MHNQMQGCTHFPLVRNDSGGKGAPRYSATAHPDVPVRDVGMQKQSLCNLRRPDVQCIIFLPTGTFLVNREPTCFYGKLFFFFFSFSASRLHNSFMLEPYSITVYSCGYREYYCNECVSHVLGTTLAVAVNKHLSIQWHTQRLAVALVSMAYFVSAAIIFLCFQSVIQRHSCLPS